MPEKKPKSLWLQAVSDARKELKIVGFAPVGGTTAAGKKLLAKAHEIHAKLKAKDGMQAPAPKMMKASK